MRSFILIFLFPVFFIAQTQEPIFSLRPSLGLNVSQVHGDPYNGLHKIGFFGGAAVNARLKRYSNINIGFYFSQKGARHVPNPAKGDFNFYSLNLNYIDVPITFQQNINHDYFFTLGHSIAYLVNYNESINYANYTGAYPFNNLEFGVNIGLGKLIKNKLYVEVRSSNSYLPVRGFGNFVNQAYYPNFISKAFNKGFYNTVVTLFVSYKITLKPKIREPK